MPRGGRQFGSRNKQKPQTPQGERLYTTKEVAKHFKVDDTTVRRWAENGSLEAVKLPARKPQAGQRRRPRQVNRFKESELKKFDPHFGE